MTIPDPDRPRSQEYQIEYGEHHVPPPEQYEVRDEVVDSDARRLRTLRTVTTLISFVTGLFAVVLVTHIILVVAEANQANGFASFVNHWATGISLGLRTLFTPDDAKLRVVLNFGTAALLWLIVGAAVNYLIRRFAVPGPNRRVRYRRTVN